MLTLIHHFPHTTTRYDAVKAVEIDMHLAGAEVDHTTILSETEFLVSLADGAEYIYQITDKGTYLVSSFT